MSFWNKKSEPGEVVDSGAPKATAGSPVGSPSASGSASGVSMSTSTSGLGSPSVSSESSATATLLPGPHVSAEDVLAKRFGKTRSALGEGTVIQGKLSFDTPVRIDGKLSGEIFSSKALIVGPTGLVDATIEAATLIVLGRISGKVLASERVELWSGSHFEGTVKTPALVVQEGSFFSGSTEMLAAQVGHLQFGKAAAAKASDQPTQSHTRNDSAGPTSAASSDAPAVEGSSKGGSKSGLTGGASGSEVKPASKEARLH